jgi:hypothetical protein
MSKYYYIIRYTDGSTRKIDNARSRKSAVLQAASLDRRMDLDSVEQHLVNGTPGMYRKWRYRQRKQKSNTPPPFNGQNARTLSDEMLQRYCDYLMNVRDNYLLVKDRDSYDRTHAEYLIASAELTNRRAANVYVAPAAPVAPIIVPLDSLKPGGKPSIHPLKEATDHYQSLVLNEKSIVMVMGQPAFDTMLKFAHDRYLALGGKRGQALVPTPAPVAQPTTVSQLWPTTGEAPPEDNRPVRQAQRSEKRVRFNVITVAE